MRALLDSLTTRGRFLGGVGVLILAAALILGQRDVLRVALLLLAVPVFGVFSLRLTPDAIRLRRTVTPARITVGSVATVHVRIMNPSRYLSRLYLASERLPAPAPSPQFTLDRMAPAEHVTVKYQVEPSSRGAYRLGPMTLQSTDGLGVARSSQEYPETDRIIVLPRVHALSGGLGGGGHQGGGDSDLRNLAVAGDYDVAIREYRLGDDLRRVHWPTTARRGELMVRQHEQSQELLADVVLDARLIGHRGEGPSGSLEWAVSAAASVCEHLARKGFAVRLVTDGHDSGYAAADDGDAREVLLDRLALLAPAEPHSLVDAIELVARTPTARHLVAILGEVDVGDVAPLARCGAGFAMVMAPAQWADLPTGLAGQLSRASQAAGSALTDAGWQVCSYAPHTSIPAAWQQLSRGRVRQ